VFPWEAFQGWGSNTAGCNSWRSVSVDAVSVGDFGRLQKTFAFFPATDWPAASLGVPARRTLQRHARIEPDISGSDLPENPFKVNGRSLLKTAVLRVRPITLHAARGNRAGIFTRAPPSFPNRIAGLCFSMQNLLDRQKQPSYTLIP
jgi:hypothetical protein